jgi:hypothetical protein
MVVLVVQTWFSVAVFNTQMIDSSRLYLEMFKADKRRMPMPALLTLSFVSLDIVCEVAKSLLMATITAQIDGEDSFWLDFFALTLTLFSSFLSASLDVDEIMVAMYSGGYINRLQEKFEQFKTYPSPEKPDSKRKLNDGDWVGYDEFESVQDDTKKDGKTDWRKVSVFALRYCVVFIYFLVVTTPLHLILF